MSRTFKDQTKSRQSDSSEEKFIPKGVVILNNGQELFVDKKFISGFTFRANNSKEDKALNQKTFHQLVSKAKETGIRLFGASPHKMGRNNADRFENFIKQNGLKKGCNYQIKEVVKEKRELSGEMKQPEVV